MVFSIKQTLTTYFSHCTQALGAVAAVGFLLAGCGAQPIAKPGGHLQPEIISRNTSSIPQPVRGVALPPPPEARESEVYTIVGGPGCGQYPLPRDTDVRILEALSKAMCPAPAESPGTSLRSAF